MADDTRIRAWRPAVPGVAEVLHARMTSHVYPMHTHESWTLLIVDNGVVRYDLHRREQYALSQVVTLLPPHVPHNGRAATSACGMAADALHVHPAHLVRTFSRQFGISPHQYLTSRRVDRARRLLLDGIPASQAAAETGFYD